jgi:hypothetical protein
MNRRLDSVEIDRIVLEGLDVTPDRAGHILRLVEVELSRALAKGETTVASEGGRIPHLIVPPLAASAVHDDRRLAGTIAQRIARAVAGPKEGGV